MINLILGYLFICFIVFLCLILAILILVKRTDAFDLSQESEDLKTNNKNKTKWK